MGGITIRHKIILVTKKRLILYVAIALAVILCLILLYRVLSKTNEQPSMAYSFLQYKDGVYTGNENTDKGNIKVEVSIKKGKIKNIKILEFPEEYIKEDKKLKDEISKSVKNIIKTQEIINQEDMEKSSYIINKLLVAIRMALEQSMLQ